MTAFEERPHSPYFGAADATPLFVVLLDEYERWTGDTRLVRDLEFEARAALNWIDEFADLQGTATSSTSDATRRPASRTSAGRTRGTPSRTADGELPGFPRATCELQGYAYDAKVRGARLAREIWHDPGCATRLEQEAAELKRRFNRDFWVKDGEYYRGRARRRTAARSIRSPPTTGTCCGAGSSTRPRPRPWSRTSWETRCSRAGACGRSPRARAATTRSATTSGRCGRSTTPSSRGGSGGTATRTRRRGSPRGILDAAQFFRGRLPEAFGGYERETTKYPVQYPTACSPQAWSTGAPLLFLRTMLGLEPIGNHLIVDPALPERWATSSCSTSPAAGGAWTPSAGGGLPSRRAGAGANRWGIVPG